MFSEHATSAMVLEEQIPLMVSRGIWVVPTSKVRTKHITINFHGIKPNAHHRLRQTTRTSITIQRKCEAVVDTMVADNRFARKTTVPIHPPGSQCETFTSDQPEEGGK